MRMMMTVSFPHEKFNIAVKEGIAGKKIRAILEEARPESVYFTEQNGKRCAVLVVDIQEPSRVSAYAEPWFIGFGADVEFRVVMSPEELQRSGLDDLGKKWS